MKLLLLGATGLVGGHVLRLALAHDAFSEVIAPTRAPLIPQARLVNPVAARLEASIAVLAERAPDAVICALGTTIAKAGSREAFRHVDHELPVAFARAARDAGVATFAIVSATGASLDSRVFYLRTKGEMERDVRATGFSSLTICRPGFIGGERQETRRAEAAVLVAMRLLAPVLPKRWRVNPAEVVAAALIEAVVARRPGCRTIGAEDLN